MFERACRGVWPGEGAVRTKTHGWGTCGQRLGTSLQAVQDVDGRDATASERGASPLREVGDGKAAPRSMEMGKRERERGRNVAGARWWGRVDCDGHLPRPYMHGIDTAHTYALPYARRSSRRADHTINAPVWPPVQVPAANASVGPPVEVHTCSLAHAPFSARLP